MDPRQPFNPYAPPQHDALSNAYGQPAQAAYQAFLQGDCLVISKTAALPSVCVKCATAQGVIRRQQKFQFTPRWVMFLFPICNLGALIAMAITTKRTALSLPICEPCNSRWRGAKWALGFSIAGIFVPMLLVPLMGDSPNTGIAVLALIVMAIISLVAVSILVIKPRTLQAKKIDDTLITLAGVHQNAADAIIRAAQA